MAKKILTRKSTPASKKQVVVRPKKAIPAKPKTDYEVLKQKAEALFMDTKLTQKQIAQIIGVSEKTLTNWANDGDISWEELRKLKSVGRPQALKKLYKKLSDLADSDAPNSADGIVKVMSAIRDLSDRRQTLPDTINTMMNFTEFLMSKDLDLAQKINKYQKEFIEVKHRESV
jgi:DNA-binding XRE family transcriptional regulator